MRAACLVCLASRPVASPRCVGDDNLVLERSHVLAASKTWVLVLGSQTLGGSCQIGRRRRTRIEVGQVGFCRPQARLVEFFIVWPACPSHPLLAHSCADDAGARALADRAPCAAAMARAEALVSHPLADDQHRQSRRSGQIPVVVRAPISTSVRLVVAPTATSLIVATVGALASNAHELQQY